MFEHFYGSNRHDMQSYTKHSRTLKDAQGPRKLAQGPRKPAQGRAGTNRGHNDTSNEHSRSLIDPSGAAQGPLEHLSRTIKILAKRTKGLEDLDYFHCSPVVPEWSLSILKWSLGVFLCSQSIPACPWAGFRGPWPSFRGPWASFSV